MQHLGSVKRCWRKPLWHRWIDTRLNYLCQSRAGWRFPDTSSDWLPQTANRREDDRISFQPNLPCSRTCHSYTGHDLQTDTKQDLESSNGRTINWSPAWSSPRYRQRLYIGGVCVSVYGFEVKGHSSQVWLTIHLKMNCEHGPLRRT